MCSIHERIRCHIREDPHELRDIVNIRLTEDRIGSIDPIDREILSRDLERLMTKCLTFLHARDGVEIRDEDSSIIPLSNPSKWEYGSHEVPEMEGWASGLDTSDDFFHNKTIRGYCLLESSSEKRIQDRVSEYWLYYTEVIRDFNFRDMSVKVVIEKEKSII